MRAFLHSDKVLKELENTEEEKEMDMCKALEEILEEGIEKGEAYSLIRLVCKKIQKNKPPAIIAEELETEIARVKQIYDIAGEFALEYNCEQIYERLQKENNLR